MSNIKSISTNELLEELARRKTAKKEAPKLVKNPKWDVVIELAKGVVESVSIGEVDGSNDDEHYMYEEVMKALYGPKYFDWHNENT